MNETPRQQTPGASLPDPTAIAAVPDGGGVVSGTRQLGDYTLLELLVDDPATETWRAMQESVQREVALELLKSELAENPAALEGFRALVQARAAVVHQYIAPVYEAQQTDGVVYYTRELVTGRDLTRLHATGTRLAPDQVISIFLATAEALAYLDGNQTQRSALSPNAIHLGDDGIPRLNNLAIAEVSEQPDIQSELEQTGQALSVLLHRGMPASGTCDLFLKSVIRGGISDWAQAMKQAREVFRIINGSPKSSATAGKAVPAALAGSSGKKRMRPIVVAGTLAVCAAIVAGAYFALTGGVTTPPAKVFDKMVRIPAGTITVDGGTESVAAFSIDEYEVTIAQYAAFLAALEQAGDEAEHFDHSDQPAAKSSHEPSGWESMLKAAKRGGRFQGQPTSLNHPVIAIDWWDTYAYAQWKGRRLPTAAEWHLAALGSDPEAHFPWGKRDAPNLYNSGADFDQDGTGGQVDGYNYWAPVNAFSNDRSPRGVFGMAGNVSEWVDTWTHHPEFPDVRVPVVVGGSFAAKIANITERRPAKSADVAQLAVGFRTARSESE